MNGFNLKTTFKKFDLLTNQNLNKIRPIESIKRDNMMMEMICKLAMICKGILAAQYNYSFQGKLAIISTQKIVEFGAEWGHYTGSPLPSNMAMENYWVW